MKSILVALDPTASGSAAMALAVALAKARGAAVTGASVLDTEFITAPMPGVIGSIHYKAGSDQEMLRNTRARNEALREGFLARCKTEGVPGVTLTLKGEPAEMLREAAATHDVIAIGRECAFHGEGGDTVASTIAGLLKNGPRPLIVTSGTTHAPSHIAIAYDGSVPAARALQLFVLLGIAADAEITVLSAHEESEMATRHVEQAGAYLALHGLSPKPLTLVSAADSAELIAVQANAIGADMVVMGAYGRRGWREALLGSFTQRFLERCTSALFIHH